MRKSLVLPVLVTVSLLTAVVPACNRETRANGQALLPSNEVAGWARVSEVRTFEAADLWKYIDGDAERYLKLGVQRVQTADYKFQNAVEAAADVYAMPDSEGATKLLASEPMSGAKPVQLGDEARQYSQSVVFRRGPYLVRLVAFQQSAEVPPALMSLARNIDERLKR